MKPEYIVYGLIFIIAGLAFIFLSDTQQVVSYGVYIVIIIGAIFFTFGVFASKKQVFKFSPTNTFSPPERYNEKCIHLITARKPADGLQSEMDSDKLIRYFCGAIRDSYGEPRPIDRCIKNCPNYKA
jgi:hypothetical protein